MTSAPFCFSRRAQAYSCLCTAFSELYPPLMVRTHPKGSGKSEPWQLLVLSWNFFPDSVFYATSCHSAAVDVNAHNEAIGWRRGGAHFAQVV